MTLKNGDNTVIKTFDHPDLKMLKDDIKYIYSLNKNEYPECSVKIIKYAYMCLESATQGYPWEFLYAARLRQDAGSRKGGKRLPRRKGRA